MEVMEYRLKVYLLRDIKQEDALTNIAKLVDSSFLKNEELKEMHKKNIYKPYCFNSFFPLEKDGVHKEGNIYTVILRMLNVSETLKIHFEKVLVGCFTDSIKLLTVEKRKIYPKMIEKIYSLTPCIVKNDEGYWRDMFSIIDFERWLKENLIKKYNYFYNEKIDENFELSNYIVFENKGPISVKMKNIKLLGEKITLHIAHNETAQRLAYMALGTGILEVNARGLGFVNSRFYT
ncbi:CRISPR-associated endoribonuclease Cas6 [Leptotrichia sp. OH3620_COT-345]|uniref:CRISPR-associated endoribonuclease Cas6 n=1 Tax=Leptotrichia sp. OH3620_COT-345 TaxID=2491048 RepID=UPI000F6526C7|nr:CRISPR-associated endoribonuclease Cas6 [Leptotrichia sp. OH3620_COT-345]RRD39067.1 CRISPR-associated endoribonuclease Cas6 [Leptotrichia sp. OH3620_COT-345]